MLVDAKHVLQCRLPSSYDQRGQSIWKGSTNFSISSTFFLSRRLPCCPSHSAQPRRQGRHTEHSFLRKYDHFSIHNWFTVNLFSSLLDWLLLGSVFYIIFPILNYHILFLTHFNRSFFHYNLWMMILDTIFSWLSLISREKNIFESRIFVARSIEPLFWNGISCRFSILIFY